MNVNQFDFGLTYSTRSACDYDCVFSFEVTKRTASTITVKYWDKEVRRKVRVSGDVAGDVAGDVEICFPMGIYSMAPSINA